MASPTDLPFVIVEWEDAWKDAVGDTTVATAQEGHKPIQCFSHGWVLRNDEEGIQLANEYSPNGTYRHTAFIPRKMVKKVSYFTLSRPRTKRITASQPGASNDSLPGHRDPK